MQQSATEFENGKRKVFRKASTIVVICLFYSLFYYRVERKSVLQIMTCKLLCDFDGTTS